MWTLDNFPSDVVKEKYNVDIDEDWLKKVQLATARVEGGCSGSFVSPNGLLLTNHHCVTRCVSQISTAENDVAANGFLAKSQDEEVRCEAEQLSVLQEMEEITDQVAEATQGKSDQEANEARKQLLTRLEQECEEASESSPKGKLSCESVSLYHGGQHFLYKYKRYHDVRLVFAPETDIAAFGGDPDNFNFPRWDLDMSLLRAYEDDEPAKTPSYLSWRAQGPEIGEAVFVSGHPGGTSRLLTVAEYKHQRDVALPHWLMRYVELRGRLIQFGKTGEEAARISKTPLFQYENAIKVQRNRLNALLNDELIAAKEREEQELRAAVATDPEMQSKYGSAWDEIADALVVYRGFRDEYLFIEAVTGFNSYLFDYARDLVRVAVEGEKPNEERYREYTEAALPQLRQRTLAPRPIYPELEELKLSFSLDKMREFLGPDSEYVHQVLGKKSPDTLARELISGTQLADPEVRAKLWDGGLEAIEASEDPMIRLVLELEPDARALRKRYEDEYEAPVDAASEKIAKARFAIQGTSRYPDATFTLRVTYGTVKGWEEKGEEVYPFTQIARVFERATGEPPFRLPASWLDSKPALDMETRFNQVATTDIIGGNSGSPLIDQNGNLIGLVFDGNIHSIGGEYWFDEVLNRTVSVHPAVMLEALKVVYQADALVEELGLD
jgi:hypothetical protein